MKRECYNCKELKPVKDLTEVWEGSGTLSNPSYITYYCKSKCKKKKGKGKEY